MADLLQCVYRYVMKLGHLLVIFWMKSVGDGSKEVEGFWIDVGAFLGDHFFPWGGVQFFCAMSKEKTNIQMVLDPDW